MYEPYQKYFYMASKVQKKEKTLIKRVKAKNFQVSNQYAMIHLLLTIFFSHISMDT